MLPLLKRYTVSFSSAGSSCATSRLFVAVTNYCFTPSSRSLFASQKSFAISVLLRHFASLQPTQNLSALHPDIFNFTILYFIVNNIYILSLFNTKFSLNKFENFSLFNSSSVKLPPSDSNLSIAESVT